MRVFDSPWIGWDTNPSQVSSLQTLVLIYLPLKDGKLSWLRRNRRFHKYSNLGRVGDRTGDLVVERQRSYQLRQLYPPVKSRAYVIFCFRIKKANKNYIEEDDGLFKCKYNKYEKYKYFLK